MKSYLYIGRWYSNEFRVVISFFTMVLYAITMDQVITLHIPPIITYIYIYMTRNIRLRCAVTRVQRNGYAPV